MNIKTKTKYISYEQILVFLKCAHSDQIEMCCNKIDSNVHMEIQAKTNEAVKLRNVFFTQSLMLPNIFRF